MSVRLYTLDISHPGYAAHLMLERKGIDHKVTNLMAGFQRVLLRGAGFKGGTTPALKIDGRRIQGSRTIAAALDEIQPDPPLFPADPAGRAAVLEAEEWGEREFQPIPRRLMRWGLRHDRDLLRWELKEARLPAFIAPATLPLAAYFARISDADEATVRADLQRLPSLLSHVETLIDRGTIGGAEPNAADFQIATTARLLGCLADLEGLMDGTAAGDLGKRLCPSFEHDVPAFIPADWVPLD